MYCISPFLFSLTALEIVSVVDVLAVIGDIAMFLCLDQIRLYHHAFRPRLLRCLLKLLTVLPFIMFTNSLSNVL